MDLKGNSRTSEARGVKNLETCQDNLLMAWNCSLSAAFYRIEWI
jgi:hypothetical protein